MFLSVAMLLLIPLKGGGEDFEFDEFLIPESFERPPALEADLRIFHHWERFPDTVSDFQMPIAEDASEMSLPAGRLLVVNNPVNLSAAYALLAEAVQSLELEVQPPLMIVIHADDNVSVGLRVNDSMTETEIPALPPGTDISPIPPMRMLLVHAEAAEARRTEPAFVRAAGKLRREAAERDLQLHSRELYLFPGQENSLLFGFRVENP